MSDATSFDLDERQRAMLAEMGVRVWTPGPGEKPMQSERTHHQTAGSPMPARQVAPETAEPLASNAPLAMGSSINEAQAAAMRAPPPAARPAPAATGMAPVTLARAPRPAGIETMDWPALRDAVAGCQACGLCQGRTNTVFGVGDVTADWMVIGEAPGEQEDLCGEPFVGPAGQLLDNMLKAIGLSRHASGNVQADVNGEQAAGAIAAHKGVYIANVLKCHPPGNRNPEPAEVAQCEPYLRRQVALVQPKIILAMGRFAVQSLLQTSEPIGRLRGRVHRYQGVPVVVTYHPAYLLRNLPDKAKAWADLCLALEVMTQQAG